MSLKKFITLLFFLHICQTYLATHIVGGVVTYKYLGLKKYEVTFKIYRDCNGGQAAFDGDPSAQGGFNRPFYFVV